MPLTPIADAETLASCTGEAYRLTLALVCAYWRGGCRTLPEDDTALMALARCSAPGWYRARERVKQALAEIMPRLAEIYAEAARKHAARVALSRTLHAARHAKRAQNQTAQRAGKFAPAAPAALAPIAPVTAPVRAIPRQASERAFLR